MPVKINFTNPTTENSLKLRGSSFAMFCGFLSSLLLCFGAGGGPANFTAENFLAANRNIQVVNTKAEVSTGRPKIFVTQISEAVMNPVIRAPITAATVAERPFSRNVSPKAIAVRTELNPKIP